MPRAVRFLVHEGAHLWEISSALEVLSHAELARPGSYQWELVGVQDGMVPTDLGVELRVHRPDPGRLTTLFIAGCPDFVTTQPQALCELAVTLAARARRTVALCSGNFVAARAGLLAGARATVHWKQLEAFRSQFPEVEIVPGRLYLDQGPVWSCAGDVSALHVTLALVEADFGPSLASRVARDMLIYTRRDGMSPQISTLLNTSTSSNRMRRVVGFIREHLREPLPVERLAEVALLSPRQFTRAFKNETGITPARFIERVRVEEARPMVENTRLSLGAIAREVGFACEDRMREAFLRVLGRKPTELRDGRRTGPIAA
ncbi:GlxA family transcriptional regulator [Spiribacter halobius]|uniref:AraC family transcriptional regulator n=1 Tax=Sediminicurvatus halobius TaxID=2182432 RepID=A0A2U2N461_9GAMM|nr:helix-turn-helix domain-containing protein [Spiribacter halobius]PWG63890.1 AraC family transcriptional regulator [Spiribacter halobius]UEX76300.1 helix-turn-helix domain-containing protein [Spiribacter halobius]